MHNHFIRHIKQHKKLQKRLEMYDIITRTREGRKDIDIDVIGEPIYICYRRYGILKEADTFPVMTLRGTKLKVEVIAYQNNIPVGQERYNR